MRYLLFATDLYLVGLGLTVALVVYPSFHLVGSGQWLTFHRAHVRGMAYAVAPVWIAQGIASFWWLVNGPCRGYAAAHAMFAMLAVILFFANLVPVHRRLERHHDSQDIRQLQRLNWMRTAAWIACALLVLRLF